MSGTTSAALFKHAFNVPVGAALMVRPGLSVVVELTAKNRDLPSSMNGGDFGWALGLKRAIGGHYFEILLTNSNATHADQYVTSTYQGTPLNKSDIHLGFNIERRFGKRAPTKLRNLRAFDDEIGEIDIRARLARLGVLALCALFGFQLLALALGLLALTLDDGNLWPAHKPPHNEKGRIAPALSSIARSAT